MATDRRRSPGPFLLVGEAEEDWTGDARFHEYSTAADPVGDRTIPPVPVRQFPAEIHRSVDTGLVPLDLSTELGVPYPASSPALLAAFVVLAPGAALTTTGEGTSELYHCLEGSGRSWFRCSVPGAGPTEGGMAWSPGDFFVLPGGCTTEHQADQGEHALLYRVTDAPLLHYLGAVPGEARFSPTRYDGRRARELLAAVERDPDAGRRSRVSILLGNAATPLTLTATHTLWAMLGILPAGRVQRPHRHQSAALDLITACRPGCYSLVGAELGADGSIVDPVRVDWEAAAAFVTPPGLWHSHHNESGHPAYLVPVQDAGLHTYLRTLDIRFTPGRGLSLVEFASSVSRHPVTSQAVGEVAGAVLEVVGDRPDLVVVTVTRPHVGALEDVASTIGAVLHPLATLGAAAESVVGRGTEVEETPAISLWAGRVGPLLPVELTATRLVDDSWHFGGWPESPDFTPSALLAVADPFTFPMTEFLAWLEERHPGLPVVGGNASGARGPGGSRLVLGSQVLGSGAAAVLLGSGIEIEPVVSQGCRPYGRMLTVTRSDRNIVYEVAGKPAMECLVDQITDALRPADVAGIEGNGLFIGRLVDEHVTHPGPGDFLVRSVVGVDRSTGAVAVEDRVPLGSTIQFHLRDAETAGEDLDLLLHGNTADSALVFLCSSRGTRLFDVGDHDAGAVERALGPVPVGGLFTAGEFGPIGGVNFVHTFAASMALLSDR